MIRRIQCKGTPKVATNMTLKLGSMALNLNFSQNKSK